MVPLALLVSVAALAAVTSRTERNLVAFGMLFPKNSSSLLLLTSVAV